VKDQEALVRNLLTVSVLITGVADTILIQITLVRVRHPRALVMAIGRASWAQSGVY
jgi:hypothetical protein